MSTIYVMEAANLFCGDHDPTASKHLTLSELKLPPLQGVPLSRMFAVFEEHKERLQVIEHSLGQCSLESVFNQFASQQDEERGVVHGMAR